MFEPFDYNDIPHHDAVVSFPDPPSRESAGSENETTTPPSRRGKAEQGRGLGTRLRCVGHIAGALDGRGIIRTQRFMSVFCESMSQIRLVTRRRVIPVLLHVREILALCLMRFRP